MPYVMNADHSIEPMDDIVEWERRFELDNHTVGADDIGEVQVMTTFLGVPHGTNAKGEPLLFETLVYKGPLNGTMRRWATYREAEEGHRAIVALVRSASQFSS